MSTRSPTLYVDYALAPGASIVLPDAEERALYGVDAPYELVSAYGERRRVEPGVLAVLPAGAALTLAAAQAARVVLIGGAPLGPRFIWWNFVSSRRERMEQAKSDWAAGRFPGVPGDDGEPVPLPPR